MGMKGRPHAAPHAMIGPEHLLAMTSFYRFERRASRMIGSKRVVIPRMPVLGQDHMAEGPGDAMDHRHDILAPGNRQGAPITKVVLHINDKQNVTLNQFQGHGSSSLKNMAQDKHLDARWLKLNSKSSALQQRNDVILGQIEHDLWLIATGIDNESRGNPDFLRRYSSLGKPHLPFRLRHEIVISQFGFA